MSWFRICALACIVIVSIAASAAQAPANAQPGPNQADLLINANLVLVDVVATENGKPVHGLVAKQFRIFENGQEQTIVSFDAHLPALAPAQAVSTRPLLPSTWTNVPAHPESEVANVLLLDGLNTPAANQMEVRRQMLHFLGSLRPGSRLAVFTLGSRLHQLTSFTTDTDVLAKALKSADASAQGPRYVDPEGDAYEREQMADIAANSPNTSGEVIQYMQQFRADNASFRMDRRVAMTLEALDDLARYLSAIPGRKNLIWFSESFPVALDPDTELVSPFAAMRNYSAQIRETSDLFAAARVAVYPVDARGLMNLPSLDAANSTDANEQRGVMAGGRPSSDVATFSMGDTQFTHQLMAERTTMQQIADATGGRAIINSNAFDAAIASAIDDGSSYYTIGYVPSAKQFDGRFRKLQVKLDDSRLKLAYRRGYYADPPDKPSPHRPGETSLLMSAALHGAPASSQVQFQVRVLASDDPQLKSEKLPDAPAGQQAGRMKGPVRTYVADLRVEPRGIVFDQMPDGLHHARLELVLVAYDKDGKRTNYVDKLYYLDMKPDLFAQTMRDGITARLALEVPAGPQSLRVVAYDPGAERAGSMEIPLPSGR